jgi:hypothetical protein
MGYLDTYYDPSLVVNPAMTPDDVKTQAIERLERGVAIAACAAEHPRRLSDATREELALDKRRSRRIKHALAQSLRGWGGEQREATQDEKVAGAQVDWPQFVEEWETELLITLRHTATWAKKTTNLAFGKTAIVKLSQEREWLRYAMRD